MPRRGFYEISCLMANHKKFAFFEWKGCGDGICCLGLIDDETCASNLCANGDLLTLFIFISLPGK